MNGNEAKNEGRLTFTNEVLTRIAYQEALQVEGVVRMTDAGDIISTAMGLVKGKNKPRGVEVEQTEDGVSFELHIDVKYGDNIVDTARQIRERTTRAIEQMTGLRCREVNVFVNNILLEDEWKRIKEEERLRRERAVKAAQPPEPMEPPLVGGNPMPGGI